MWNDVCELAELKVITNKNGFEEKSFIKKEVFCNEKSVTSDEFYKSCQEGEEIKVVLVIKQVDFDKEKYVLYEGEQYKIKRTYKVNSEDIELHCVVKEGLYNE